MIGEFFLIALIFYFIGVGVIAKLMTDNEEHEDNLIVKYLMPVFELVYIGTYIGKKIKNDNKK